MVQLQSQIKFIESHIPYICSCVLPVKLTLIKKKKKKKLVAVTVDNVSGMDVTNPKIQHKI